jgi:hypothetical protein
LLPAASAPLGLAVAAFASPSTSARTKHAPGAPAEGANAFVSISVDAGAFAGDGAVPVPLDIGVSAVDQTGRQVAAGRQTSTVGSPHATSDRPAAVNVQTHLDLEAGDYEVRVAVADRNTGLVASVFAQVAIPKFASAPLSLSDVVIETDSNTDSDPAPVLPIVPTTRRSFSRTDQVRPFLQIYEGTRRTDAIVPVSVRVRVIDALGHAVRDQTMLFTDKDFRNRRANCQITLPVEHLAAGEYLLSIDAVAEKQTARRALRFAVQ